MYNCKINCTTAKFYVGIIEEISTTAKTNAQLQKNSTTAKTNAQLQKQMHNCDFHLFQLYYYFFPRSYDTSPSNGHHDKVATSRAPGHCCLSRAMVPQGGMT
jgi:hypothetical protein